MYIQSIRNETKKQSILKKWGMTAQLNQSIKLYVMVIVMDIILTISPFILSGGNHETIILVFDAGIAFISCGADGTVKLF